MRFGLKLYSADHMLFTTPLFLFVFLPVFLTTYYLAPNNPSAKNVVALIGSVLFFAWGEPIFVLVLLIGTYIDYRVSLLIEPSASPSEKYKKIILSTAIILNSLLLICSKYLNFICSQMMAPLDTWLHIKISSPNLPLILGISFITFHKISYLVDSYKGRAEPPRNFFDCALYIFLFPQLIAGPIIRYHDIGSQIHARKHTAGGFLTGFSRFSIGLIKKLLLADPLGQVADQVFGFSPEGLSCFFAWGGIIAYTLQIYFDFSGYSDMAIGLGRMIGFRFPENFNRPYISQSVTEFWRRWHISLSNWMRLYLYIPLGGNRGSMSRTYLNLWVVFLISGIWHGASWNFVVWGAYYGFFLCLERAFSTSKLSKDIILPSMLRQALTLLIIIVGWVFFRSPSLSYAISYILVMFGHGGISSTQTVPWGTIFNNHAVAILLIAALLATIVPPKASFFHPNTIKMAWSETMDAEGIKDKALLFSMSIALIILSAAAILSSDYAPFLYFRF